MSSITVTKRISDYHACLTGEPGIWGCGPNINEAIGDLVKCHPTVFNLEIIQDLPDPNEKLISEIIPESNPILYIDASSYDDYDKVVVFLLAHNIKIAQRNKLRMYVGAETTKELVELMKKEVDFDKTILCGAYPSRTGGSL